MMRYIYRIMVCYCVIISFACADEVRSIDINVIDDDHVMHGSLGEKLLPAGLLFPAEMGIDRYNVQINETLRTHALHHTVDISYSTHDRKRRIVALITMQGKQSLQEILLQEGLALLYRAPIPDDIIMERLRKAENSARAQKKGLWAEDMLQVITAEFLVGKEKDYRNQFRLVEGKVTDISHTKYNSYINFGEDWKQDMTVMVAASDVPALENAYGPLDDFKDKTLLVRGWIEAYNGPLIRAVYPSQILVAQ